MEDTNGVTSFEGEVYALSFDQRMGECQASLRNSTGNLSATTIEPRLQTLLETAMLKSIHAVVEYEAGEDSQKLVSVSINID